MNAARVPVWFPLQVHPDGVHGFRLLPRLQTDVLSHQFSWSLLLVFAGAAACRNCKLYHRGHSKSILHIFGDRHTLPYACPKGQRGIQITISKFRIILQAQHDRLDGAKVVSLVLPIYVPTPNMVVPMVHMAICIRPRGAVRLSSEGDGTCERSRTTLFRCLGIYHMESR